MWKSIETSVFFGMPVFSCALALAGFGFLALRCHRGRISTTKAILLYLLTLLLPILFFASILATAYLAKSFSDSGRSMWGGDAGWAFVLTVFPLTALLGCTMLTLNVLFWLTLFISSRVRKRRGIAPVLVGQHMPCASGFATADDRRPPLFVRRLASTVKLTLLFLASWIVGLCAYLGALLLFHGQSISSSDLKAVLFWSLLSFSLSYVALYLPVLNQIRRHLGGVRPLWPFPVFAAMLGLVPTALIALFFGDGVRSLVAPESRLFYAMFGAIGAALGIGYAYIHRNDRVV